MKPIKLLCLLLVLTFISIGCEKKEPEPPYWMTEAEAKVLAETKAYLEAGGQVDAVDDDGKTRLHKAAEFGYKNVAELLIAKGAKVNVRDGNGDTPLHKARTVAMAELLIDKGVHVNARGKHLSTPLHYVAIMGRQN